LVLIGDVTTLHASTGTIANLQKRCIPSSAKYYSFVSSLDTDDIKMAREIMLSLAISAQGSNVFAERMIDDFYGEGASMSEYKVVAFFV